MNVELVLTVAALAVAVIGLPLTYMWGRKSRRRPELRYVLDFDVLMKTERDIVRGPFLTSPDGNHIDQVSRTYLAFWNHRGDTVSAQDAVTQDPIRVELAER
jgi:hypothetical protein